MTLFVRLNSSKPLSGSEVRAAMKGIIPELINKLAAHQFFREKVRFSTKRKQDHNVAAKLLLIEHRDTFVNTKKTDLDRLVIEGLNSEASEATFANAAERVIMVLDEMNTAFENKDEILRSAGAITLYYWIFKNSISSPIVVKDGLSEFEKKRLNNRRRTQNSNSELLKYDLLNRSTDDATSLVGRYFIVREFLLSKGIEFSDSKC